MVLLHLSQITSHMFLSPLNRDGVMEGLPQTGMQTRKEDLEVTSPGDSLPPPPVPSKTKWHCRHLWLYSEALLTWDAG